MKKLKSKDELEALKQKEKYLILDFTAEWCGPCQMAKPLLEWVEDSYPKLTVVAIDVDRFPKVSDEYKVQGVPTLYFIRDGEVWKRYVGVPPLEEFRKLLREFQGMTLKHLLFG